MTNGHLVKEVMKEQVITTNYDEKIKDAAEKMASNNVGSIIIVKNDEPIGIVTERDFVRRLVAMEKSPNEPISELMTLPIVTISEDTEIWDAAERMKKENIHKLPVTRNGKLAGIVTNTDLTTLISSSSNLKVSYLLRDILARKAES